MAFAALRDRKMNRMAEVCWPGLFYLIRNLLDRVARDACIYAESLFTVVACSARLPFFHVSHGEALGGNRFKEGGVAYAAIS